MNYCEGHKIYTDEKCSKCVSRDREIKLEQVTEMFKSLAAKHLELEKKLVETEKEKFDLTVMAKSTCDILKSRLKIAVEALEKIDDIDCSQTAMERTAYQALEKIKAK
jgi:uracil phosphoribosyltransferase